MPAQDVIVDRLYNLLREAEDSQRNLTARFVGELATTPTQAIDSFGMELAETELKLQPMLNAIVRP